MICHKVKLGMFKYITDKFAKLANMTRFLLHTRMSGCCILLIVCCFELRRP